MSEKTDKPFSAEHLISLIKKFEVTSRWLLAGSIFSIYQILFATKDVREFYPKIILKYFLAFHYFSLACGIIYILWYEIENTLPEKRNLEVVDYHVIVKEKNYSDFGKALKDQWPFYVQALLFSVAYSSLLSNFLYS